jgi:hypothetical protein
MVVTEAMQELVETLQTLASVYIPQAYRLGLQAQTLTKEGERWLQAKLESNRDYLSHSLAPSLMEQLDSLEEWTEEIIAALLLAQRYRVVNYVQPYWEAIWEGFGDYVNQLPEITGVQYGVARRLDPLAEHCTTCPPKAKVYSSWSDMIKFCGGLPSSLESNDDCNGGCRCWLELVRL